MLSKINIRFLYSNFINEKKNFPSYQSVTKLVTSYYRFYFRVKCLVKRLLGHYEKNPAKKMFFSDKTDAYC
jgi:hypothetical protein